MTDLKITETVMGVPNMVQKDESMKYAVSVIELNDLIHLRQFKPWMKSDTYFKLIGLAKEYFKLLGNVHGLRNKVVNKKKSEYHTKKNDTTYEEIEMPEVKMNGNGFAKEEQNYKYIKDDLDADDNLIGQKKRKPFLDSLMDYLHNGTEISEQEVNEQVDTIMFEVNL